GTPGTDPTHWSTKSDPGVTKEIVGTGEAGGIHYVDIRLYGTTGETNNAISFESASAVAAEDGQTWTVSAYLALVGGDLTNVSAVAFYVDEYSDEPAALAFNAGPDIKGSLTADLTRFESAETLSNAATAYARPVLRLSY